MLDVCGACQRLCNLGKLGYLTPIKAAEKYKAYAQKALELDNSLPEPHVSLAAILLNQEFDPTGAEREFLRAIELNPNYAGAHHWYASGLLGPSGRFEIMI